MAQEEAGAPFDLGQALQHEAELPDGCAEEAVHQVEADAERYLSVECDFLCVEKRPAESRGPQFEAQQEPNQ